MADQFDFESQPKIELHVHLEGSVDAETGAELAVRHGYDPQAVLPLVDGRYPKRFTDFQQFIDIYLAVSAQIRDPADLRLIAEAFAHAQAKQNVLYTETTFTAITHVGNGMDPSEMWGAVREGLEAGGGNVGLIVDTPRDFGVAAAHRTIEMVEGADAPIVGLGLSGMEGSVPEGEFRVLRDAADELGLGLAAHAGETGGPEQVWAALALEDHPFPELWRAGVNVTINSDDPPFFSATLTAELSRAAHLARLTKDDIVVLQRRAARAAFAPHDERKGLEERVAL